MGNYLVCRSSEVQKLATSKVPNFDMPDCRSSEVFNSAVENFQTSPNTKLAKFGTQISKLLNFDTRFWRSSEVQKFQNISIDIYLKLRNFETSTSEIVGGKD